MHVSFYLFIMLYVLKKSIRLRDFMVIQRHHEVLALLLYCHLSVFFLGFNYYLKRTKTFQITKIHKKKIFFIINLDFQSSGFSFLFS